MATAPMSAVARARSLVEHKVTIVLLPAAAFALWSGRLFYQQWRNFRLGIDFAYFSQAAWLIGRLKSPFLTFGGIHILGDHAELTFFVLALIGRPFRPQVWLPVVQIASVGLGALPLSWIARRAGLKPFWVMAVVAVFLFQPGSLNLVLADFHAESLVIPLYLFAVWAALERRWWVYGPCVALAALTKEDQGIVLLFLGLWLVLSERERLAGALTAVLGVAWTAVAVEVLIPHYSPYGTYTRGVFFGDFGPTLPEAVRNMLTHPATVARVFIQVDNGYMLLGLVAAWAFLPMLAPRYALPAAGMLVANMLSSQPIPHTIAGWYHAAVMPFVAVAAVHGLARALSAGDEVRRRLPA